MGARLQIKSITARPLDIPLLEKFTISKGVVVTAQNLYVTIEFDNGVSGLGECAPFPDVTGENREGAITAVQAISEELSEARISGEGDLSRLSARVFELAPTDPAARCGVETALLDAYCRNAKIPLWRYFGAECAGRFTTDITIPISTLEKSVELADSWYARGFRKLKMKVGNQLADELAAICAISEKYSDVSFVIDANCGFSVSESKRLIDELKKTGAQVSMIEQPVAREDLAGMAELRAYSDFPICADESAFSLEAVEQIQAKGAADIINVKIMKTGLFEAQRIAKFALANGLEVMFGGMVESRLSMGTSLALASGCERAHTIDLDTPLLLATDPLTGGYTYSGPEMRLTDEPGHGMSLCV